MRLDEHGGVVMVVVMVMVVVAVVVLAVKVANGAGHSTRGRRG